ncbi:tRNA-dihydrouridine(47) synthase [NAD(P)(+)]-like [Alca torda]
MPGGEARGARMLLAPGTAQDGRAAGAAPAAASPDSGLRSASQRLTKWRPVTSGSVHLGDGYQNIVNTAPAKQWEGKSLVRNNLSKELQHQLRKRRFSFRKADEYLRGLGKPHGDEVSNCTAAQEGLGDGPECPALPEQGEDPKADALQSPSPTAGEEASSVKTVGPATDEGVIKLRSCEKKQCGNLPFRRICKRFGADVTCGEMAVCTNLLQGQSSEWALLKRHHTEDIFGVQLEGAFPDTMTRCAELLNQTIEVEFVDISVGCALDLVYKKGGGCARMTRSNRFAQIVRGMNSVRWSTCRQRGMS